MNSMLSVDLAAAIERSRHEQAARAMFAAQLLGRRRQRRVRWTGYRIRQTRVAVC